jgi:hypothetical protein
MRGQKILDWIVARITELNLLLIASWTIISFVPVVPKNCNFATVAKDLLRIFTIWFVLLSCDDA